MNQRIEELRSYCLERLNSLNYLEKNVEYQPAQKLRLKTKQNILNHLIDYKGYANFLNKEQLNEYIESRADIVCGFYED